MPRPMRRVAKAKLADRGPYRASRRSQGKVETWPIGRPIQGESALPGRWGTTDKSYDNYICYYRPGLLRWRCPKTTRIKKFATSCRKKTPRQSSYRRCSKTRRDSTRERIGPRDAIEERAGIQRGATESRDPRGVTGMEERLGGLPRLLELVFSAL